MTLTKASEVFGEEYDGFELHTFPVKDGQGFYVTERVDNTRKVYDHHIIKIIFNDGSTEETYADTPQELELWTKHLG